MAINKPDIYSRAVANTGKMTQVFFRLVTSLVDHANNAPVIVDNAGSPEGVVNGRYKDQCWDTVNNKLYFKSTSSGDTGWVALN